MQRLHYDMKGCTHHYMVLVDAPNGVGCEECLRSGDTWLHLRLCRTCGHVGCCDSSKNRHARAHFLHTSHPIVTSIEPGESWSWCFVDESFLRLEPVQGILQTEPQAHPSPS